VKRKLWFKKRERMKHEIRIRSFLLFFRNMRINRQAEEGSESEGGRSRGRGRGRARIGVCYRHVQSSHGKK
jgi:hypothetical protein